MVVQNIHIDELKSYVEAAFEGDDDIVFYYDRKEKVKTIQEAAENVVKKINKGYSFAEMRGVKINGAKVGYFIYTEDLLVSFGINKGYRLKEILIDFWEEIKKELGETFQCLLYSYNTRAIDFLRRNGMNILFENTTLLRFENNLN